MRTWAIKGASGKRKDEIKKGVSGQGTMVGLLREEKRNRRNFPISIGNLYTSSEKENRKGRQLILRFHIRTLKGKRNPTLPLGNLQELIPQLETS